MFPDNEQLQPGIFDTLKFLTDKGTIKVPQFLTPVEIEEELWTVARAYAPLPEIRQPVAPAEPPIIEVLELGQLYNLIDEWDRQPWVWDGILPHSSLSLIVGKSETGKSTLIYSLIHAIVNGLPFFGRPCEQGRVVYLAGDPVSEIVAGKTFRSLGLDPQQGGVTLLRGALASDPKGMLLLRQVVERVRPACVIADTLASAVSLDVDKYGQSYQAQQPLSQIARQFKPNFLMSHHSQKSAIDSYSVIDAALGSVGVAAVASTRMATKMYRRKGEKFFTFEMSNCRIGRPIEGEWITRKFDNGLVELDGLWKQRTTEIDKETIVKTLEKFGQAMSKRTLWSEMRPKPKYEALNDALDELIVANRVRRMPATGKGGGWHYALNQDQENKNY